MNIRSIIVCELIVIIFGMAISNQVMRVGFATSNQTIEPLPDDVTEQQLADALDEIPVVTVSGPGTVTAGQVFSLDGSGSYDPDGGELGYEWTDENGSIISTSSSVEITAPSLNTEQEITISLLVFDDEEDDAEASHTIMVRPIVDRELTTVACPATATVNVGNITETTPPPIANDLRNITEPTPPPIANDLRNITEPTPPPPIANDLRNITEPTPPPIANDLRNITEPTPHQ